MHVYIASVETYNLLKRTVPQNPGYGKLPTSDALLQNIRPCSRRNGCQDTRETLPPSLLETQTLLHSAPCSAASNSAPRRCPAVHPDAKYTKASCQCHLL